MPAGRACSNSGQSHLRARHIPTGKTAKVARTTSGTYIDAGRFVGVLVDVVVARLAGECQVPQAEHVEGRDRRPRRRPPKTASRAAGSAPEAEPGR